jgi:hypothetical protein
LKVLRLALVPGLTLALLGLSAVNAEEAQAANECAVRALPPQLQPVPSKVGAIPAGYPDLTYYAGPLRTATGSIDIDRTLDAIRSRGARKYSYLIYNRGQYKSQKDWDSLPEFLATARLKGIRVIVTLAPPPQTSKSCRAPCKADDYPPFNGSYDRWFGALGAIARTHPALEGSVMDDYGYSATGRPYRSCGTFAPGSITRWRALQSRAAGRPQTVRPVLYINDFVGRNSNSYVSIRRELRDGVVWPFFTDFSRPGLLTSEYQAIKKLSGARVDVMVYAYPYQGRVPTAAQTGAMTRYAMANRPAAVTIYQAKIS